MTQSSSTHTESGDPAGEHLIAFLSKVEEIKPRMRGWLHLYAAAVSIVTGISLIAVTSALKGDRAALATSIYAASVTMLFATSALYHRLDWRPRGHAVMKRLDHSMIFILIAGTYSPFAILTLPDPASVAVLAVVWSGALGGVLLKMIWPAAPQRLSMPLYVALGWVAVFVIPQLLRHFGVAVLVLILAGGACYTAGAVSYGFKRPNPFPNTYGFHEVFHSYTLLGASCHYVAVWLAIFSLT